MKCHVENADRVLRKREPRTRKGREKKGNKINHIFGIPSGTDRSRFIIINDRQFESRKRMSMVSFNMWRQKLSEVPIGSRMTGQSSVLEKASFCDLG